MISSRSGYATGVALVLVMLISLQACGQTPVKAPENAAENPATHASTPVEKEALPEVLPEQKPEPKPQPAALTVDRVLDQMETARKELKTFKAKVVKQREIVLFEETEKYTGDIQFKMPRLLRLELKRVPKGDVTIRIVGKKYAWVYWPQKKTAQRATLKKVEENKPKENKAKEEEKKKKKKEQTNPLEYGLARDIHELRKAYTLKLLPAEKIGDVETAPLELTPIGGTDYKAGKLIFWIDKTNWLPAQIREHKSNDEIIETHTFSEIKLKELIKDKVFEFKPPKDVEVNILPEPE